MNERKTIVKHIAIIVFLSYIFLFHALGDYSLKEPDEGRYAEIPREMIETGEYAVPHLNHVRYFEKPPLFYWAVALSYNLFGINEWSFRFPNALSAFLCILAVYFFSRRWFGGNIGFLASIILLSSFGFFAMARLVTLDMHFTLWLTLSLLCFYGYYREKQSRFIYMMFIALGCATLTKGPVALILMGITIIIFLLSNKQLYLLKDITLFKGLIIYAIITLPWFILICIKEKEFFYFFFIDQHILRFITSKHKRSGPIYYFLPVLFGGMLPWSIFIPRSIISFWKDSAMRLFIIWSAVVFLFFSLSGSKLPPYILPLFPSLSIVLASYFTKHRNSFAPRRPEIFVYIIVFAIFSLCPLLYHSKTFLHYINNISADSLNIFLDLKSFSIAIGICSFAVLCLLLFKRFHKFTTIPVIFTAFSLAVIILIHFHVNVIDRLNTTKNLASVINAKHPDYLVNYSSFDETLPFYVKHKIFIAAYKGELEMGSKYDDTRYIFLSDDDLSRLFNANKKIIVILKAKRIPRFRQYVSKEGGILHCEYERCLISNY